VIFVDSSFWIAEMLPRDRHHGAAVALARRHWSERLSTSNQVAAETWTYLRRRSGHAIATRWLDRVLAAPGITVHRIDEGLEDEAWSWLRVHDERPYSLVDATSFALMRRTRITEVLAFDGDFAAAGFTELQP
jgi:uncharacterized protein